LAATLMNAFFTALLEFIALSSAQPDDKELMESILPCVADCARCYA